MVSPHSTPLPPPTVLYPLTLPALLDYILSTQHGSSIGDNTLDTTLIICSSRDVFLRDLALALQSQSQQQLQQQLQQYDITTQDHHQTTSYHHLGTPSLRNLFMARHVRLTFCASVPALLAHLTAVAAATATTTTTTTAAAGPPAPKLPGDSRADDSSSSSASPACNRNHCRTRCSARRIVLVNSLALHAPTPSFSAQGLSRSFAAAVEAAARLNAALLLVECTGIVRDMLSYAVDAAQDDAEMTDPSEEIPVRPEDEDPWEQEVSILNVSAKRFGSGSGDRGWAGRTVKAKRIAARWFHFHKLDSSHVRESAG